jgi:hypothetical protein
MNTRHESHGRFQRCYALASRWHESLHAFTQDHRMTNVEVAQAALFFAGRTIGRILVGDTETAPGTDLGSAVQTLGLDEAVTVHVDQFECMLRLGIMSAVEVNRGDIADPPERR